jgi:hypothetical protein
MVIAKRLLVSAHWPNVRPSTLFLLVVTPADAAPDPLSPLTSWLIGAAFADGTSRQTFSLGGFGTFETCRPSHEM